MSSNEIYWLSNDRDVKILYSTTQNKKGYTFNEFYTDSLNYNKVSKQKDLNKALTLGEVAEARRGKRPPQAMIRLSASWEMRCTVFTTNMAFSLLFTKSSTLLVEWLEKKRIRRLF